jgi:hypothetical protein
MLEELSDGYPMAVNDFAPHHGLKVGRTACSATFPFSMKNSKSLVMIYMMYSKFRYMVEFRLLFGRYRLSCEIASVYEGICIFC